MSIDIQHLQQWAGKSEQTTDTLTLTPLAALAATLDHDDAAPKAGDAIAPLAHWLYFLPTHRQSLVGPDGHPQRGGFLPPVALPRRMWAGSRVEFLRPLHAGDAITRVSTIGAVSHKSGRSGELVFVKVVHEVSDAAGLALREEQDLVYRDHPRAGDTPPAPQTAPSDPAWVRLVQPDPVLLFRYSALTLNGHRIHYDRPYAMQEEGYAGLVVHGPLLATLLIDGLRQALPSTTIKSFWFRGVRPVIDHAPFQVCGKPEGEDGKTVKLWIAGSDGGINMEAGATLA